MFEIFKTSQEIQLEIAECGAISLKIILDFYDIDVSKQELRILLGTSRDGCEAERIINTAEHFGLKSDILEIKIDQIQDQQLPGIIFWNEEHFMVLEKITSKYCLVSDPAVGHRKINMKEVRNSYSNILITFEKTKKIKKRKNKNKNKEIEIHFKNRFDLMIFTLCETIITIGLPLIFILLINSQFNQNIDEEFWMWLFFIFLIAIPQLIINKVKEKYINYVIKEVLIKKELNLINALTQLPIASICCRPLIEIQDFIERYKRLTLNKYIKNYINNPLNTIRVGINIVLILINPWMGIPLLCIDYIIKKTERWTDKKNKSHVLKENKAMMFYVGIENEINLQKKSTVLINKSELLANWFDQFYELVNLGQESEQEKSVFEKYKETIFIMQWIFIVFIGTVQIKMGMSIQDLIVSVLLAFFIFENSQSKVETEKESILNIHQQTIDDILEHKVEEKGEKSLNKKKHKRHYLEIQNLAVTYNYDYNIFENVNMQVLKGEHCFISSEKSHGLTTFFNVITKLLEPNKGEIYIDNQDVAKISKDLNRFLFGYITQENTLYEGSVLENICFDQTNIPTKKIEKYIQEIGLSDCVNNIERGILGRVTSKTLSTTELVLMECLRAILNQPKLIIIDNALDFLSIDQAVNVLKILKKLNLTTIIGTKSEKIKKHCNRGFVLKDKQLQEISGETYDCK